MTRFNRYRRKRPKVDARFFDSALSHTRRSDASEKREENSVSFFGRFRLRTSFESSPLSVKEKNESLDLFEACLNDKIPEIRYDVHNFVFFSRGALRFEGRF